MHNFNTFFSLFPFDMKLNSLERGIKNVFEEMDMAQKRAFNFPYEKSLFDGS